MRFTVLGSGSAGNALLVCAGDCAVLVDCGLSVREVERRLGLVGCAPEAVVAVVVTHEHDDHVGSAGSFARKYGVPLHATTGTRLAAATELDGVDDIVTVRPETPFAIGALRFTPHLVPHDAREPCQYIVDDGTARLGLLTDLGHVSAHLAHHYRELEVLLLEFNHEPARLAASAYPAGLRARIAGEHGHLSNGQAEDLLARVERGPLELVLAMHLSEKTNSPSCVEPLLRRQLPDGIGWHIAGQHEPSPWFVVGA